MQQTIVCREGAAGDMREEHALQDVRDLGLALSAPVAVEQDANGSANLRNGANHSGSVSA